MLNRISILLSALALFGLISAPDIASAQRLKLNESMAAGSVEGQALQRFKQIIEERTNGGLQISLHFNDELGDVQTSLENVKTGTLELYSGDLTYYANLIPKYLGVTSLPFLFQDTDHLRRYLTSDIFAEGLQQLIDEHGVRMISTDFVADRGPYRVFASTRPMMSLDDLQGMRMRLWPNDIQIRSWTHLGAVPSVIAFNEVYLALRQGRVEAVTSGLNGLRDAKLAEVAPYVSTTNEFPQIWPIAISEVVWQSLLPEQQNILLDAAKEAGSYYAELTYGLAEKNMRNSIAENNAVFMSINMEPFAERMEPLYKTLVDEGVLDREIFDAISGLR